MKINWCDYPIQHICHEGWRIYNPLWIKHIQVDGITPFHVSWRWWWWWWGWGWGWRERGNDGDDGDHHHHSCIVIWNVKHHLDDDDYDDDDDDDCKCGAMSELDGACLTPMDLAQTGRKFSFRYLFMCFKFQIAVVFQEIWEKPQNKPCACSFMINKKIHKPPRSWSGQIIKIILLLSYIIHSSRGGWTSARTSHLSLIYTHAKWIPQCPAIQLTEGIFQSLLERAVGRIKNQEPEVWRLLM